MCRTPARGEGVIIIIVRRLDQSLHCEGEPICQLGSLVTGRGERPPHPDLELDPERLPLPLPLPPDACVCMYLHTSQPLEGTHSLQVAVMVDVLCTSSCKPSRPSPSPLPSILMVSQSCTHATCFLSQLGTPREVTPVLMEQRRLGRCFRLECLVFVLPLSHISQMKDYAEGRLVNLPRESLLP